MNDPLLSKVFLALRTDFVPNHPKEHVTLRYYKSIRWSVLLQDAARLDKKLPATIIHKGRIESWTAGQKRYRGLYVSSPDSTILDHLAMPHITIPHDNTLKKLVLTDLKDVEVIDTLWVGKKSPDGGYIWAKVSSEAIPAPEFAEEVS